MARERAPQAFKIVAGNMLSFFHLQHTSMGRKVLSGLIRAWMM